MKSQAHIASSDPLDSGNEREATQASGPGPFVINLCSSNTPMALEQPRAPELKRFTFFVSRRLEDGRERFRLHMGYFDTLEEAEEWLSVVREVYPGAWAGEAPGKRLRERAAASAAARTTSAAGPAARTEAATRAAPAPSAQQAPAQQPAPVTTHARAAATPRPAASPAPASIPTLSPKPAPAAAAVNRAPAAAKAPAAQKPAASPAPAAPARPAASAKPVTQQSNVREVLASLDDPVDTREMPSPPPVNVPVARPAPAPAQRAAATSAGMQPMRAKPAPEPEDSTLTDTQVLRILEDRRADGSPGGGRNDEHSTITLLRPDDTGTRRALKEAVQRRAPVSFAVQLMWSVQPIDLAKVPPLAIFSAYTLYTVEGSREGRRWYGLRLGFFSDAISAKQVAYYVRSEFASVAVVPVSPQERERATQETSAAVLMQARKPQEPQVEEFKLIDDEPPRAASAELPSAPAEPEKAQEPAARSASNTPASRATGTRRAGRGGDGRVNARKRRPPQTLEETLEILGAHELEIDDGRDTVSETGVRHLKVEVRRNTPFSRLLDRLTERISRS